MSDVLELGDLRTARFLSVQSSDADTVPSTGVSKHQMAGGFAAADLL